MVQTQNSKVKNGCNCACLFARGKRHNQPRATSHECNVPAFGSKAAELEQQAEKGWVEVASGGSSHTEVHKPAKGVRKEENQENSDLVLRTTHRFSNRIDKGGVHEWVQSL